MPQPWAWAIVNGHQQLYSHVEELAYRGSLLIHSQRKGLDRKGYRWLVNEGFQPPPLKDMWRGYIVGEVSLLDCLPVGSVPLPADMARWQGESGFNLIFGYPKTATGVFPVPGSPKLQHAPRGWARAFRVQTA